MRAERRCGRDVNVETGGLSEGSVRETLARHHRVKAVIAIHTWGRPEDLDMVCAAAAKLANFAERPPSNRNE